MRTLVFYNYQTCTFYSPVVNFFTFKFCLPSVSFFNAWEVQVSIYHVHTVFIKTMVEEESMNETKQLKGPTTNNQYGRLNPSVHTICWPTFGLLQASGISWLHLWVKLGWLAAQNDYPFLGMVEIYSPLVGGVRSHSTRPNTKLALITLDIHRIA